MTKFSAIFLALMVCILALPPAANAQNEGSFVVSALSELTHTGISGEVEYHNGVATVTNGIYIKYAGPKDTVVLTADRASLDYNSSDVEADGNVRISESGGMSYSGEHIHYNFTNHVIRSEQFRLGYLPVFAGGQELTGHIEKPSTNYIVVTNAIATTKSTGAKNASVVTSYVITTNVVVTTNYMVAKNAFVTTDDYGQPAYRIRASTIKIIPGDKVQMWNAVAYVGNVPVFYFPYYERDISARANNFTTTPGYRSIYGPYLLNTYNWFLGDMADGKIHADIRERRGPGVGPDVKLHMGNWGEAQIRYYYQYDERPNTSTNAFPAFGNIPENRQRFYLGWQATPATNLNLKALVNYQSDPLFLHDFFPGDYVAYPQPNTFVEANKYWDNWSLDALTTPRVNDFFNQVERLPDVQLTGYRQQVLGTPVYYDSQSSAGWYRAWNANPTNGLYPGTNGTYIASAARADTYHQITLPWTFFNWLNVTPRVGGRLTYYSSLTNGPSNDAVYREVFNTGLGVSFKASQLWPDATNSLLQVDGLRHIIEPSANYVYVPDPSVPPAQLPPFDSEIPALMLSPVDFPDYNSIDSVDTMNVIRFGLRNILQTKRAGQLDDLVNWNVLLDWRLDPRPGQTQLNDLYSALSFRPRSWLTAESQVRYNIDTGELNLAFHQLTFTPSDRWSWGISHWYLRSGFVSPDENNFITSTFYFKLNENWGLRAAHTFNATDGRLQEQTYTIMRDLRSWTAALSFRVENNLGSSSDFTVAFSFSIKAVPSTQLGDDSLANYRLLGE